MDVVCEPCSSWTERKHLVSLSGLDNCWVCDSCIDKLIVQGLIRLVVFDGKYYRYVTTIANTNWIKEGF